MRDLVQLAATANAVTARPARQEQKGDHGFGEMLRTRPDRHGPPDRELRSTAADGEPAPGPFSMFQLKVAHRLPEEHPVVKWLQMGERPSEEEAVEPENGGDAGAIAPPDPLPLTGIPAASPQAAASGQAEETPNAPAPAGQGDAAQAQTVRPTAAAAVGQHAPPLIVGGDRRAGAQNGGSGNMERGARAIPPETMVSGERSASAERLGESSLSASVGDGGTRRQTHDLPTDRQMKQALGDLQAREQRTIVAPASMETQPEAVRLGAPVRVVEAHSLPAPAQIPAPAATLSAAMASAPDWMAFARASPIASAAPAPGAATPVKSLTVQLHPAELGMVTAKLHFAGDQLSIELQVEKVEAYDRLAMDRDAIMKAVRALGIEVDRVTVQQPQAQPATAMRGDNAASFHTGSGGREASFSAGSSAGREGGGDGGHRDPQDAEPYSPSPAGSGVSASSAGRGLYI